MNRTSSSSSRSWLTRGLLVLTSGCGTDPGVIPPIVTVEKRVTTTDSADCYAPCGDSASPSDEVALDARCSDRSSVSGALAGGVDRIRVVVDYSKIRIDDPSGVPAPKLQLIGDGANLLEQTLTLGPIVAGTQRPFAYAEVVVPAKRVIDLVIRVDVGGGQIIPAAGGLSSLRPTGTLSLPGCPQEPVPCVRAAQVGVQAVTVNVPSNLSTTSAAIISFIDGVPEPATLSIPLTPISNDRSEGTRYLQVPPSGKSWQITGRVGDLDLQPQQVGLAAPDIRAQLEGCPAMGPCSVSAGGTATVLVSAPIDTQVATANVRIRVDGVDTGQITPLTLIPCADGLKCSHLILNVPNGTGKSWQAFATVGLYEAFTTSAAIVP